MPSTKPTTRRSVAIIRLALLIAAAPLLLSLNAAAQAQAPATVPAAPLVPPPNASVVPRPAPKAPRILIFLDPAHGGTDTGTRLSGSVFEKDITLAISFRLRSLLAARGFTVLTTREADAGTPPTPDERADLANHASALACVLIHATASGNGVHIFNSSLPATSMRRNAFLPWDAAQSPFIDRSIRLAAELHSAFDRAKIPVTLGRTYLRPLDNLTCPAVAVEIAPLAAGDGNDAMEVSSPAYQQRAAEAIAWALTEWRLHSSAGEFGRNAAPQPSFSGSSVSDFSSGASHAANGPAAGGAQ